MAIAFFVADLIVANFFGFQITWYEISHFFNFLNPILTVVVVS